MEDIKLFYFDGVRGRVECIRMLLHAAGVEFEDVRIKLDSWKNDEKVKKETPYSQLPYVIYKGKKIGQSVPIASYFAKKFGFYGKTDEEVLREEEVIHLAQDFRFPHFRDWFFADGEVKTEKEEKMKKEHFPRFLGYFEELLKDNGGNGFFVGKSMTLVDMMVYDLLETALGIDADTMKGFPLVQKLHSNVQNYPALNDYLANRPPTAM